MERITVKAFEELVSKDDALSAKAKEFTSEGEELKEKVKDFAASLGYELVSDASNELSVEEMGDVAGGITVESMEILARRAACIKKGGHFWVLEKREEGIFWGVNAHYKCSNCKETKVVWE